MYHHWWGHLMGCWTVCLCVPHSWLLQRSSTCTSMDFSSRSVCSACSSISLSRRELHKHVAQYKPPAGLFSTVLHTSDILAHWKHPFLLRQCMCLSASGTLTQQTFLTFPLRRQKISDNVVKSFRIALSLSLSFTLISLIFFLGRWHLSCFSPTFPPSSEPTACSGRRWYIPCYWRSAGQASPSTPCS